MPSPSMRSNMRHDRPVTVPGKGDGVGTGADQAEFEFQQTADPNALAEQIEVVYSAAMEAAEQFGGVTKLAAFGEQPIPKLSARFRRGDDGKGNRQYGRFDDIAIIACDREARTVFLAALAEAWGFEPPQPKRVLTEREQLVALLDELADSNGIGKDILKRAAKRAGTDAGAFRRPR